MINSFRNVESVERKRYISVWQFFYHEYNNNFDEWLREIFQQDQKKSHYNEKVQTKNVSRISQIYIYVRSQKNRQVVVTSWMKSRNKFTVEHHIINEKNVRIVKTININDEKVYEWNVEKELH